MKTFNNHSYVVPQGFTRDLFKKIEEEKIPYSIFFLEHGQSVDSYSNLYELEEMSEKNTVETAFKIQQFILYSFFAGSFPLIKEISEKTGQDFTETFNNYVNHMIFSSKEYLNNFVSNEN